MRQQKYSALILFSALVITNFANAAPKKTKPAEAPKAKFSKVEKKPKKAGVRLIPSEYNSYFQARSVLAKPGADLAAIESAEHSLLLAKMSNEAKTLDKDQEELFYALEIRRAEKFAQKKEFAHATESFQRALNGLGAYKWIYYWSETSSKNLASVCNRNKKQKDEACLTLAKRVADAFPKVALETKALRDLPSIESAGVSSEIGSDRLSQTYSEKIEKDEKAFEEILAYFLNGSHSDLLKTAKAFINDYPKSILRFRAQFLMAETYFKKGDSKEAQPLYQAIIDQTPISYYALIASERLNKPLREMVKNDFVKQIDVSQPDWQSFNLNLNEKSTIERALALRSKKHYEEVGIELDSLNRARAYSTEFLLYLMQLATATNQNLTAFRTGNELIGRRYDGFLRDEMLNMIFPDRFNKEIEEQSVMNHVDPLLILSLMKQESGFKSAHLIFFGRFRFDAADALYSD